MKITVGDKARQFLVDKDRKNMTLYLRSTGGGWCGIIQVPEVAYDVPEVQKGFETFDADGITIYIQKSALLGAEHIKFLLKGFWIFKGIVVEGVKYPQI